MSETMEEYLKTIWVLEEENIKSIRIKDISTALAVKPPSVVQMLTKLEEVGLIHYIKHKEVCLTKKGKDAGQALVRYHRLMEVLFSDVIEGSNEDVEILSCGAEHFVTPDIAKKICTFLNHPDTCPHGKPIPRGDCCNGD
ncbi:MAG: metal-dependent transcriptional regulator [Candidatus Methanofastidiosia archaeon]